MRLLLYMNKPNTKKQVGLNKMVTATLDEWTEVALGEENGYNFFKVTVEMR